MAFTRNTIIRGPAQVIYNGEKFYSQGDIRVSVGHEVFPIINSSFGHVQDRSKQRTATVQFTPVGNFSETMWGFGSKKSGDPLLDTGADTDLVVWSYGGTKATIYNVGITKMPDLILSTTKTLAGEITFTGLGKGLPDLVDQATTDAFVKIETGQGAPSELFDPQDIITEPYDAAWGSLAAPWDHLKTEAGWHCSFDLGLQPVEIDSHGIIDWTVGDVKATARAKLLGVSEAEALAQIGIDITRGGALISTNNLVITGTTALRVTLYATQVRIMPAQYGLTTTRLADMEFMGTRKIVSNAIQDVFKVEEQ